VEGSLEDLPAAVEVAVYRIAMEAVTNVAKHAKAASCTVVVSRGANEVRLEVRDDGVGATTARPDGVGLGSMRARAEELGGALHLIGDSSGTVVAAAVPLHVARSAAAAGEVP
jgi:two-component system, NarL family, sensor kinase